MKNPKKDSPAPMPTKEDKPAKPGDTPTGSNGHKKPKKNEPIVTPWKKK